MQILTIILGCIVLLFGRKLFWLFVAIIGFLVGVHIAEVFFAGQPLWVLLLIGLGAGLIGALLAVVFQRIAFALAGFYGGAYLVFILTQSFGIFTGSILLPLAGGVIGAIVAALVTDWAIIVLSCLAGAGAVVAAGGLGQTVSLILFVLLIITGIIIQARLVGRIGEGSRHVRKGRSQSS